MLIIFWVSFLGTFLALGLIVLVDFVASRFEVHAGRTEEVMSRLAIQEIAVKALTRELASARLRAGEAAMEVRARVSSVEGIIAVLQE